MAENLKTTRYRNGLEIRTTSTPAFKIKNDSAAAKYQWAYEGDEKNLAVYRR
jgi:hypothetical protein